jgi:hypothetical protein
MRHSLCELKSSSIHGRGVFAVTDIPNGTRIVEYKGERITQAEADRRYEKKLRTSAHTFLFAVNERTVIDGGRFGNIARYINHSCDPNCETVLQGERVFIEAVRDIVVGEELLMDYRLQVDTDDEDEWLEKYPCRCGAMNCRGTLVRSSRDSG